VVVNTGAELPERSQALHQAFGALREAIQTGGDLLHEPERAYQVLLGKQAADSFLAVGERLFTDIPGEQTPQSLSDGPLNSSFSEVELGESLVVELAGLLLHCRDTPFAEAFSAAAGFLATERDGDPETNESFLAILRGMGELDFQFALDILEGRLRHSEGGARKAILLKMLALNERSCIERMWERGERDSEGEFKEDSLKALSSDLTLILPELRADHHEQFQQVAREAVESSRFAILSRVPELLHGLSSSDDFLQLSAKEVLGTSTGKSRRLGALCYLGKYPTPDIKSVFFSGLRDQDRDIAYQCGSSLHQFGHEITDGERRALSILSRASTDLPSRAALMACAGLGFCEAERDAAIALLWAREEVVREEAFRILCFAADREEDGALSRALEDRIMAGGEEVAPLLNALFELMERDPSFQVSSCLQEVFCSHPEPEIVLQLAMLLKESGRSGVDNLLQQLAVSGWRETLRDRIIQDRTMKQLARLSNDPGVVFMDPDDTVLDFSGE
jgi:hypothetical protein